MVAMMSFTWAPFLSSAAREEEQDAALRQGTAESGAAGLTCFRPLLVQCGHIA
jgi:hypothetical protein